MLITAQETKQLYISKEEAIRITMETLTSAWVDDCAIPTHSDGLGVKFLTYHLEADNTMYGCLLENGAYPISLGKPCENSLAYFACMEMLTRALHEA